MLKAATIAAIGLLNFVSPKRPAVKKPQRYDTKPYPGISESLAKFKPEPKKPAIVKKHRAPRKKHICEYTRHDIWGAFIFGLLLGGFIIFIIL